VLPVAAFVERKKMNARHLFAVALAAAAAAPAMAAGPVLTPLVDAVDSDTVIAAILAIGAVGVGIRLAWVGVKYVKALTKSS
jgi:hypothetical protein